MYRRVHLMSNLCVNIRYPRSVLILAYLVAQALSIYFLLPRKTSHKTNEKDRKGCLQKVTDVLTAITNSKLFKLYKKYRYPWIPLVLQLVETFFQILAFYSYVIAVPTRYLLIKFTNIVKCCYQENIDLCNIVKCCYQENIGVCIYKTNLLERRKQSSGIPRRYFQNIFE